jgi:hypothetical protein
MLEVVFTPINYDGGKVILTVSMPSKTLTLHWKSPQDVMEPGKMSTAVMGHENWKGLRESVFLQMTARDSVCHRIDDTRTTKVTTELNWLPTLNHTSPFDQQGSPLPAQ